jgi:hypothetical protein
MNKNYKKIGLFLGLVFGLILLSNPLMETFRAADDHPGSPQPALVPGDLIFMEKTQTSDIIQDVGDTTSNDHVALYIGHDVINGISGEWCVSAGFLEEGAGVGYVRLEYYIDGVQFDHLKIGRVITASQAERIDAIEWAEGRVGAEYQHWYGAGFLPHPIKCADPTASIPTANQWYCSELVWAAYYNTSDGRIDIDNNGWGLLPYFFPCVNMGVPIPGLISEWLRPLLKFLPPYAYENEIQIDDDINLISWT